MPSFSPELLLPHLAAFRGAEIGWIAYSGGMDSAVLLCALASVRDRLAFEIRALHVDHGLHPDSGVWVEHCARTCRRLGVALETRSVVVAPARGESLEAVARQARYATMAELLGTGDLVLTAHHRDDQAETLLLALMRGSGPAGLAAMPPVASLGSGRLVRPLLGYGRAMLLDYANSLNLDWLDDPGNLDPGFDRNFLRHQVLPLLAERWPACAASIARSAAHCAEAQELIDRFAEDELFKLAGRRPGTLSISRLHELPLPLRKTVLRRWVRERGFATPDSRHLGRIISEVMAARVDANPLVTWPGCEVRRYRDDLYAIEPLPAFPATGPIPWREDVLLLPNALGCLKLLASDGRGVDPAAVLVGGLDVLFGATGLSCRTTSDGHRKSLKKLFQEAGVPPWVRPFVPLIFLRCDLVAVGDLWVCHNKRRSGETVSRIRWESDLRRWLPLDSLST
jgi:tRNA(Ile)-lysidine synthase